MGTFRAASVGHSLGTSEKWFLGTGCFVLEDLSTESGTVGGRRTWARSLLALLLHNVSSQIVPAARAAESSWTAESSCSAEGVLPGKRVVSTGNVFRFVPA